MEDRYYSNEPWSFGSLKQVKLYNPQLTEDEIKDFFSKSEVFSRFKKHKRAKKYSPIFVYTKRELFQADVVFFTDPDMVKMNSGFKYLFTCIDCFTKMAWIYPMKRNTCENVMKSFKNIIEITDSKPERLNSDRGSELICNEFKTYLKQQNIHHFLAYSLRKCPIIERFNLTIQNILYKIMVYERTLEWTKYLSQAMDIYLHRKHMTIDMSPMEAEKDENQNKVRSNLLTYFFKRGLKKRKPKFHVKDTVRIWKKRGTFQRGYDEDFSREYFTIIEVKRNLPVPRYVLKDSHGDVITGSFFEDELVEFKPGESFEIKVLETKKRGKTTLHLVHYIGYPSSMDEWVNSKQLTNL